MASYIDAVEGKHTSQPNYDTRHGGPYDRGSADSYYGRGYHPHYFEGATSTTPRVEMENMTAAEIAAYTAGYRYGEELGEHKEW